ncbi:MAG: hypothetical protein U5J82_04435 [Desulfobacterales bacterium]|nr:hypothetical protein [Desulfobacterales bacterium]
MRRVSTVAGSGPILLVLLAVIFAAAPVADAGLTVYDRVTGVGSPVFLEVETRRFGFPEGGTRVRLFLDGRALGEILTGADGRGYLKYTPSATGELRLAGRWQDAEDTGRLLVLGPKEKVVVVEVDSALRSNPLDLAVRAGSAAALETLTRGYRLIYLGSLLALHQHAESGSPPTGWPQTLILRRTGGQATFKYLAAHGVHPFAVVGSAGLLSASKPHVKRRFSFEQTADGETIKDWPAVLEALGR